MPLADEIMTRISAESLTMAALAPPRILVVAQEPGTFDPISVRLRAESFDVEVARSGQEALERLARSSFAMLVTDLTMPGISVQGLLDQVRENRPEMAVILLTAPGGIESAIDLARKGATDFLTKPVRSDELILRVHNALHRSELEREVREMRVRIQCLRQTSDLVSGHSLTSQRVPGVVADPAEGWLAETPQPLTYDGYKQKVLESTDRAYFESMLRQQRGNVSEAARAAGLDRKSFWRKMKRHGLEADTFRSGA
jgi:DNA-binding NtrC family response regulator